MPPISLGGDPLDFARAIVAGNFTGSPLADLAVVSDCFDGPDNVSILLNQGNGAFDLMLSIPLGTFVVPSSITTGNFFKVARSTSPSPTLLSTQSPCSRATARGASPSCRHSLLAAA